MAEYQKHGLYLHNWYRKRHGSPKMELSERLNKAADAYAYKLACRRQLVHTSGLDYNENLYMSIGDRSKTKKQHVYAACEAWYNEKKYYSYSRPGFSMQTGHFTAMVWKNSTNLGIGYGESNGYIVVVACYKPHANGSFNFGANVLPYREVEDSDAEEETSKGPSNKEMAALDSRLKTFSKWPSSKSQLPSQFALAGFYFTPESGKEDRVSCFQCGTRLHSWVLTDNVWLEHEKISKDCPHLTTFRDETEKDVFNKYLTTVEKRLKTFENWPADKVQTKEELSEAGFYFMGHEDKVACYYCDICIWDWDQGDSPWIAHETVALEMQKKLCPFLERNKEKLEAEKIKNAGKAPNLGKSNKGGDAMDEQVKELFKEESDENGNLGREGLGKILNRMFEMEKIKVQLPPTASSLLISLMTIRNGEKKTINIEEFENALNALAVMSETAEKFDKDRSTTLDPFELKEALEYAGFLLGYKTFQTLKTMFCKDGDSMDIDAFVICYVLLSKLQIVREMSKSSDMFADFSLKEWMEEELEKAGKF